MRYAGLDVEEVRLGRWRSLRRDEVEALRRVAGLKKEIKKEAKKPARNTRGERRPKRR